jgi:hypothetical protein
LGCNLRVYSSISVTYSILHLPRRE